MADVNHIVAISGQDVDTGIKPPLLIGLPASVYCAILQFLPRAVLRLIIDRRLLLSRNLDTPSWVPDPEQGEGPFERWLIERWLREIRSDEFTASAEGQYLIAEWERGR